MKPRIFIGSSVEGLEIAHAIQEDLQYDANTTVWTQGVFKLSRNILDDLLESLNNFDFGIFVFSPDDILEFRGQNYNSVRDNVIFELGLFFGKLGKDKVFFLMPQDNESLRIPTDLIGITAGKYNSRREDGNLQAAVGPFCNQIRKKVKDFVYENLNDLQYESLAAKNIAIQKPAYWGYLLFAQLLEDKLGKVKNSFYELENGLVFIKTKNLSFNESEKFYRDKLTDFSKLITLFVKVVDVEMKEAIHFDQTEQRILLIKNVVEKIVSISKELLQWEFYIQEANPEGIFIEVKELLKGWSAIFMPTINDFPDNLRNSILLRQSGVTDSKQLAVIKEFPKIPNIEKITLMLQSVTASYNGLG